MEILTIKEAADYLRVSENTLRRRMREGLPFNQPRPGCKVTFNKATLEKWWRRYERPRILGRDW